MVPKARPTPGARPRWCLLGVKLEACEVPNHSYSHLPPAPRPATLPGREKLSWTTRGPSPAGQPCSCSHVPIPQLVGFSSNEAVPNAVSVESGVPPGCQRHHSPLTPHRRGTVPSLSRTRGPPRDRALRVALCCKHSPGTPVRTAALAAHRKEGRRQAAGFFCSFYLNTVF